MLGAEFGQRTSLSLIYQINEKISFSPEINFNFRDHKEINNSLF